MLSRRHLRVKVSQVLYTCEMDKDVKLPELDKYLHNLLSKSEELYYLLLIKLIGSRLEQNVLMVFKEWTMLVDDEIFYL